MDYEPDSYRGVCAVCGGTGTFSRQHRAIRETYRCPHCGALLRERHQAQAIVDAYGGPSCACLARLVQDPAFARLRVYEPGTAGRLRAWLRRLAYYRQSDLYEEALRGSATEEVPHQDLEALTWGDGSFDLVVTSDILEHVRHPEAALAEVARVLTPGGRHIFTVPLQDPLRPVSVRRVDTSGETDVPLLPERYHGDGKGGRALVYVDFGEDLLDMIRATGMEARFERGRSGSAIANTAVTVVSRRPPGRRGAAAAEPVRA
jgi:SAM-dependent methyltransferase